MKTNKTLRETKKINMLTEKLLEILDHSKGERELCRFLKYNPFVLTTSLSYLGRPRRVIAEFPLGNDYKADFVVLAPYSGAFEIRLIEIEPPESKIFNKDGTLARRANKALEQVNSWRTYIEKNKQQFLRDIEKYAQTKDLIQSHSEPITCTAGSSIHDPSMWIYPKFDIIIGRRKTLDKIDLERKAGFGKNGDVSIITSDRLLQGTEIIDEHPEVYR